MEPRYFHICLQLRFYLVKVAELFEKPNKTKQDGFGGIYFVSIPFERGVFYDELPRKLNLSLVLKIRMCTTVFFHSIWRIGIRLC